MKKDKVIITYVWCRVSYAALVAAVLKLASNRDQIQEMGSATRAYVVRHFNRSDQAQKFVGLVSRLEKVEK